MDVHYHKGVGPIRFGMAREEVLDLFSVEATSFKRNQVDTHPCNYFPSLGLFVYYGDESGLVEAVELTSPAKPSISGADLLHLGFIDLLEIIRGADPEVSIDGDGFTSFLLGIGGWAPSLKSAPNAQLESIIVFAPGYYD